MPRSTCESAWEARAGEGGEEEEDLIERLREDITAARKRGRAARARGAEHTC